MTINLQELYDKGELKPGDEFILRNGESAWFVGLSSYMEKEDKFIFECDDEVGTVFSNGSFFGTINNAFDIVRRAPVKKTFWLNVYKRDDGYFYCGMLYENEKEALNCGHETESYISTIQIEIEV